MKLNPLPPTIFIDSIIKHTKLLEKYSNEFVEAAHDIKKSNRVFFIGNGASAAMAEHYAADWSKNCGVDARSLITLSGITAYGNDEGYENIFSLWLQKYSKRGDFLIAISSSGNSKNIIRAVGAAKDNDLGIMTLTGINKLNAVSLYNYKLKDVPLNKRYYSSPHYNFFVDSSSYGIVECVHNIILHSLTDLMVLNSGDNND